MTYTLDQLQKLDPVAIADRSSTHIQSVLTDVIATAIKSLATSAVAWPSEAAQPVPEGWQLVPKEPTPEMTTAAMDGVTFDPKLADMFLTGLIANYRKMLAAIPPSAGSAAPSGEVERDAALKFADHIINGIFEGGDWDGGDVQELAENYGLLKPETMQAPCNEDGACQCAQNGAEFPSTCYRKTYVAAITANKE